MTETLKYQPGHTAHTDDCMSEWGERGRHFMSAQTIACNHRLHLSDYFPFVCSLADCGWASNDETAVCPDHGYRVDTGAQRAEEEWVEASSHPSYYSNMDY